MGWATEEMLLEKARSSAHAKCGHRWSRFHGATSREGRDRAKITPLVWCWISPGAAEPAPAASDGLAPGPVVFNLEMSGNSVR